MPTEIRSSSPSVVRRRTSEIMEEAGGLMQPIRIMCLDDIVRCASIAEIEEEKNENVKTLQNIFSKPEACSFG